MRPSFPIGLTVCLLLSMPPSIAVAADSTEAREMSGHLNV